MRRLLAALIAAARAQIRAVGHVHNYVDKQGRTLLFCTICGEYR